MEIISIFTDERVSNLWAVKYDGHDKDIFSTLFDLWNEPEYLTEYLDGNSKDLFTDFWKGKSIDEAIENILDEAGSFEDELYKIENKETGYEGINLGNKFVQLHNRINSISTKQDSFKKAKPNKNDFKNSMLRLYAYELEGGIFIVTGGAIKLTREMDKSEIAKIEQLKNFLDSENICNFRFIHFTS